MPTFHPHLAHLAEKVEPTTDLAFLRDTGFNAFEVVEAAVLFQLNNTVVRATVVFDGADWAHLDFTVESRVAWRRRIGNQDFQSFLAAVGIKAIGDNDDTDVLVGRRGALRVSASVRPEFARLAA